MSQQAPVSAGSNKGTQFKTMGAVVFGVILWATSQGVHGEVRHLINGFLGVLLLSMVLLNWKEIGPLFFKNGG